MSVSLSEEKRRQMLSRPVPGLVTSLAIPTVIASLITVIYNTADTYFVSRIDQSASAAVGAVYAIMSVIQAVGYGFGMGAGSITSRKLGEGKKQEADRVCTSAFFASFFTGLLVTVLGLIFFDRILRFLGCSDTMMVYARPYAFYILLSAPFACSGFVLNNVLRSEGNARLGTVGTGLGGVLNLILDPLFIFGLGMGCGGAAVATGVGQVCTFLFLLYFFLKKKTIIDLSFRNISRSFRTYGQVISAGLPTVFRQSLGSVATVCINVQAVIYGDACVAAVTVANKVYTLIRFSLIGIGQGFQPVAGYNYGAGRKDRTRQAFCFATAVGTVFCTLAAVIIALFADSVIRFFLSDPEVISLGRTVLYANCAVLPVLALSTFINQLYQCLGFRVQATFLASLRQGIFFVPAVFLLPLFLDSAGVCIAQAAADGMTFLVSLPFLFAILQKQLKT